MISNISLVPCLSSIGYIYTLDLEDGETFAAFSESHMIKTAVRQAYKWADRVF